MKQTEQLQRNGNGYQPDAADTAALQLHEALALLAGEQRRQLPRLLAVTFLLGLGYLAAVIFVLPEPYWFELAIVTAVSLLLILFLALLLRRRTFALQHISQLTGGLVTIVFGNLLLRLLLLGESSIILIMALVIFFTGVTSLTAFWYLELIILSVGGYVLALLLYPLAENWFLYGMVLAGAAAAGLLLQRRTLRLLLVQADYLESRQSAAVKPIPTDSDSTQLETVVTVGQQLISILDLEVLLAKIADLIYTQYQIYYVAVYLPHQNGVGMHPYAQAGRALEAGLVTLEVGLRGQIGWVMAHGKPLRLDDVGGDPGFDSREKAADTRSELILPLKIGSRVLGVLDLQSDRRGRFREDDLYLFQSLANQIAIALENARLYAEVKAFNSQLEEMVDERTAALQEAYARLERMDKTKADFITIASHELRTPLTIASMNAQMIMQDETLQADPRYAKWASGIVRGVNRMENVVQSMLDVARIDSETVELSKTEVRLRPLLGQLVSSMRAAMEERAVRLQLGDFRGVPPLAADPEALQKVFYHLLNNAVKYTPDGGRVLVDGRAVKTSRLGDVSRKAVEVVVADTGIGIDPAVQELIFEKFYQTGEVRLHSSGQMRFKGGGSGLGLAIVRGLVAAHGGLVWVESKGADEEKCPGAIFHVLLPLA